jgi:DNA modification methylase
MQGYLDTMVGVCREVRRVLKPEGTFWLNIGDSYAGSGRGPAGNLGKKNDAQNMWHTKTSGVVPEGLKPKDLCMIPNRLAILLQEDGWYVRSEIIWHKPNPMPESVRDRPTNAHEKVWLLTKSQKYYYDADAIAEKSLHPNAVASWTSESRTERAKSHGMVPVGNEANGAKYIGSETRNCRNVWSITTKPFKGAHFATMPPDLVERCIKAGCPVGGNVLDPFGGSGTTGMVAARLQRKYTLIELNADYIALANARIDNEAPLLGLV